MDKKDVFIRKARQTHGDKYDYSKVEYVNSMKNVCIICPTHGEFWMTPQSHVRGCECQKCANIDRGGTSRSNIDEFIKRARAVHGDKYDYSKVIYKNAMTKITIICPIHGEFETTPMRHLIGQGCPKCEGRSLTQDEVIERFKNVHGDKYDYSQVKFTKMHEKVKIICPKHGEFWQTPSKHYSKKQGCPLCGVEERTKKKTMGKEEFVRRTREIHGDKYDYSKVEYTKVLDKVCIICPQHGEFWQRAYDHLHGHGCSQCNSSHLEEQVKRLLDENNIEYIQWCNGSTIEWLHKQSLDFYLPKYNVAIECQGDQHFQALEHFGGEEEFKKVVERDQRKAQLCKKNGIKLLYFARKNEKNASNDIIFEEKTLLDKIFE